MKAPVYLDRLVIEGAVLAACGAIGSIALLVFVDDSRENPASTIGQLAFVLLVCVALGVYLVRRWTERSEPAVGSEVSGDPTPLWLLPLIVVVLALAVGLPTGAWDASLRVTGGCVLVGLTQAALMAPLVRADERRRGRRYLRLPGSSLITGTRLGFTSEGATARKR